jgi:hypothetical protein
MDVVSAARWTGVFAAVLGAAQLVPRHFWPSLREQFAARTRREWHRFRARLTRKRPEEPPARKPVDSDTSGASEARGYIFVPPVGPPAPKQAQLASLREAVKRAHDNLLQLRTELIAQIDRERRAQEARLNRIEGRLSSAEEQLAAMQGDAEFSAQRAMPFVIIGIVLTAVPDYVFCWCHGLVGWSLVLLAWVLLTWAIHTPVTATTRLAAASRRRRSHPGSHLT